MAVTYRKRYGPVELVAADRVTTKYRSGRKVGTNGEGLQRCRAIAQAKREAGPGARQRAAS